MIVVTVDLPWPFSSREAVLDACGVDDIDENGDICVLVRALDEFNPSDESLSSSESIKKSLKIEIPSVEEADVVRIGFQGGFLFRALPEDWDDEKPKAKAKASEAQESQKEETTMSYTSWLTSGWGASAKDDTVPPNVDGQFKSPPVQGTNDDVDSEGDAFEDCEDGEDEEENDSTQKDRFRPKRVDEFCYQNRAVHDVVYVTASSGTSPGRKATGTFFLNRKEETLAVRLDPRPMRGYV